MRVTIYDVYLQEKKNRSIIFIFILCSLRKQPIFCDDATGFPPTEMTSVEQCRNSILIMTYYCPDLGSVSDWSKQSSRVAQPVRTATHIWVVIRHQCGISALFLQTSFCGETSFGVVICRLFSQAKYCAASKISCQFSSCLFLGGNYFSSATDPQYTVRTIDGNYFFQRVVITTFSLLCFSQG